MKFNLRKICLITATCIVVCGCDKKSKQGHNTPQLDENDLLGNYQVETTQATYSSNPDGTSSKSEHKIMLQLEFNKDHTFRYDKINRGKSSYPIAGVWSLIDGNQLYYCADYQPHYMLIGIAEVNKKDEGLELEDLSIGTFSIQNKKMFKNTTQNKFSFEVSNEQAKILRNKLSIAINKINNFDYNFRGSDSESQFKERFYNAVKNKNVDALTQLTYFSCEDSPLYYYLGNYNQLIGAPSLSVDEMTTEKFKNMEQKHKEYGLEWPKGIEAKGCLWIKRSDVGSTGKEYGVVNKKWAIITGLAEKKK